MDSNATYVPPEPNAGFEAGFSGSVPIISSSGHVSHSSLVTLQIDLYDPDGADMLVWSLTLQSFNPDKVTESIKNLSDVVVSELKAKELI